MAATADGANDSKSGSDSKSGNDSKSGDYSVGLARGNERNRAEPKESACTQVMLSAKRMMGLGIASRMYHNDHTPPHFHARCAGEEAVIDIESRTFLDGWLPPFE